MVSASLMQMIFPEGCIFLSFFLLGFRIFCYHRSAHASEIPSTPEDLFRHVKIISPGPVLSALLDDLDALHEIRVAVP